jgi:hypothetical protein
MYELTDNYSTEVFVHPLLKNKSDFCNFDFPIFSMNKFFFIRYAGNLLCKKIAFMHLPCSIFAAFKYVNS